MPEAQDPLQPSMEFLTPAECAEVDKALLTSQDKFMARVAIYALRALKQVGEQQNQAIADLRPNQIADWVFNDPSLQDNIDQDFRRFFSQIVISALKPLTQAAQENGVAIEDLSLSQLITWFEQEARKRILET